MALSWWYKPLLVGGIPTHSEKYESLGIIIPNLWKVIKIPWFQTTNQMISYQTLPLLEVNHDTCWCFCWIINPPLLPLICPKIIKNPGLKSASIQPDLWRRWPWTSAIAPPPWPPPRAQRVRVQVQVRPPASLGPEMEMFKIRGMGWD